MNAAERRGRILEYLRSSDGPLAAAALAQKLSVSRQIIVGDVALLRAAAAQCRISEIAQKEGKLVFSLEEFHLESFSALCVQEKYQKRLLLMPGDVPRFSFRLAKNEDPLRGARQVVRDYAKGLEG